MWRLAIGASRWPSGRRRSGVAAGRRGGRSPELTARHAKDVTQETPKSQSEVGRRRWWSPAGRARMVSLTERDGSLVQSSDPFLSSISASLGCTELRNVLLFRGPWRAWRPWPWRAWRSESGLLPRPTPARHQHRPTTALIQSSPSARTTRPRSRPRSPPRPSSSCRCRSRSSRAGRPRRRWRSRGRCRDGAVGAAGTLSSRNVFAVPVQDGVGAGDPICFGPRDQTAVRSARCRGRLLPLAVAAGGEDDAAVTDDDERAGRPGDALRSRAFGGSPHSRSCRDRASGGSDRTPRRSRRRGDQDTSSSCTVMSPLSSALKPASCL